MYSILRLYKLKNIRFNASAGSIIYHLKSLQYKIFTILKASGSLIYFFNGSSVKILPSFQPFRFKYTLFQRFSRSNIYYLWLLRFKYTLFMAHVQIYSIFLAIRIKHILFEALKDQICSFLKSYRFIYKLYYNPTVLNIYYFMALQVQIYTISWLFRF